MVLLKQAMMHRRGNTRPTVGNLMAITMLDNPIKRYIAPIEVTALQDLTADHVQAEAPLRAGGTGSRKLLHRRFFLFSCLFVMFLL